MSGGWAPNLTVQTVVGLQRASAVFLGGYLACCVVAVFVDCVFMALDFFHDFFSCSDPARVVKTSTGGFATFGSSNVVVEFRSLGGVLNGVSVRDGSSGVAVSADNLSVLDADHPLAKVAANIRRDAGLL